MTISMMKYIDVLSPAISACPRFTVDITKKYVPVTLGTGPYGIEVLGGLATQFQNRDNIKVLSIGIFMPENFAFTSLDFPIYDNTLGTPSPVPDGQEYTAQTNSSDVNGTWIIGHLYRSFMGSWHDMDDTSISPILKLSLSNSNTSITAGPLPGYGSSSESVFKLPFPNYELVLDLYSDIANYSRALLPNDEFHVWGWCYCPNVSMVGVPSDLDGRIMKIIPFVKIAHTCPIVLSTVEPAPPEPPIADFEWRDHNWEENEDPHGPDYHNDPIDYPVRPT